MYLVNLFLTWAWIHNSEAISVYTGVRQIKTYIVDNENQFSHCQILERSEI